VLRALGAPANNVPTGTDEAAAHCRSLLVGRRLLVVLDNVGRDEQVRAFVPALPGCAVLLASHSPLAALDCTARVAVRILDGNEAVSVLAALCGSGRVRAEPEQADRLAWICGYLPLGLRIAAARLVARPDRPLRVLVDELADERYRLDGLTAGDLSMRACLRRGFEDLRATSRCGTQTRLLRQLALVSRSTVDVARAAALLGVDEPAAATALDRLASAQLIVPDGMDDYRVPDLVRLYAREVVEADESRTVRTTAVRGASAHLLAAGEPLVEPVGGRPVVDWAPPRPRTTAESQAAVRLDDLRTARPRALFRGGLPAHGAHHVPEDLGGREVPQ
jgi:hypothetical protein